MAVFYKDTKHVYMQIFGVRVGLKFDGQNQFSVELTDTELDFLNKKKKQKKKKRSEYIGKNLKAFVN